MSEASLYLLPGESRSKDRFVPAEMLKVEKYSPSKDVALSEEDRKYRVDLLIVTVQGESPVIYPFILPVYYRPEWKDLASAAQDMGLDLQVSDPVLDGDAIGRSVVRMMFATADGAVYTSRQPGGTQMLITEKWPVQLDPDWIANQTKKVEAGQNLRRARPG